MDCEVPVVWKLLPPITVVWNVTYKEIGHSCWPVGYYFRVAAHPTGLPGKLIRCTWDRPELDVGRITISVEIPPTRYDQWRICWCYRAGYLHVHAGTGRRGRPPPIHNRRLTEQMSEPIARLEVRIICFDSYVAARRGIRRSTQNC